jgi:hypothetical protein
MRALCVHARHVTCAAAAIHRPCCPDTACGSAYAPMLQWVVFAVLAGLGHSATLPVAAPLSDATISLQGSIPNDQFGKPVRAIAVQECSAAATVFPLLRLHGNSTPTPCIPPCASRCTRMAAKYCKRAAHSGEEEEQKLLAPCSWSGCDS